VLAKKKEEKKTVSEEEEILAHFEVHFVATCEWKLTKSSTRIYTHQQQQDGRRLLLFPTTTTTTTLEGSPCWTVTCFPGKTLAYLQADFVRSGWIPFPIVRRIEKRGIIAAYFGPSHAPPPTLQHGISGPQ
jgi:hypothetical protein